MPVNFGQAKAFLASIANRVLTATNIIRLYRQAFLVSPPPSSGAFLDPGNPEFAKFKKWVLDRDENADKYKVCVHLIDFLERRDQFDHLQVNDADEPDPTWSGEFDSLHSRFLQLQNTLELPADLENEWHDYLESITERHVNRERRGRSGAVHVKHHDNDESGDPDGKHGDGSGDSPHGDRPPDDPAHAGGPHGSHVVE